jgi:prepilin-type N-terminal cleavage/methylation domain-containing protein
MRLKKAFTLVELVGAIVIIAILVGVVLVTTGSSRERALQIRVQADMEAINVAGIWIWTTAELCSRQRSGPGSGDSQVSRSQSELYSGLRLSASGVAYQIGAMGVSASHTP